jgi:uncharacterized protein
MALTRLPGLPIAALLFLLLTSPTLAREGPSYDCGQAKAPDEIAICRNARLAQLDQLTAQAFQHARKILGEARAREIARAALKSRAACGASVVCIFDRQVDAMKQYETAGIVIPVPEGIASYRKSLHDDTSNERSSAQLMEPPETRPLFSYLSPLQRRQLFDTRLLGDRHGRSVVATFDCYNCGSTGHVTIKERYDLITRGIHRKSVTIGSIHDDPKGFVAIKGLFGLPERGGRVQELSVKANGAPIGESTEFGYRIASFNASNLLITTTLICNAPREVAANTVARGATGVARVFGCNESRQFGHGTTSDSILNRSVQWTYFRNVNFFVQTYWDLPQTTTRRRIVALDEISP